MRKNPPREPGQVYLTLGDGIGDEGVGWATPEELTDPDVEFGHDLLIGLDGYIERVKHGPLMATEVDLGPANIHSLWKALRAPRCCSQNPEDLYVDTNIMLNIDLPNLDENLVIRGYEDVLCAVVRESRLRPPAESREQYADALRAVARAYDCDIHRVNYLDPYGRPVDEWRKELARMRDIDEDSWREAVKAADQAVCHIEIELIADRGATVQKLIDGGRALAAYLAAIRGDDFTALTIVDLLRGGHPELLVGRVESAFLEIKSQPYNVNAPGTSGERQKIELAQDVARFANGEVDAVLVIGFTEDNADGKHRISGIKPFPLASVNIAQYGKVLDQRIVPALRGLVIEQAVIENDKGLLFILVPRQPEELQPYLVHGAIVSDRIEGAFISIVQRRGEGSTVLTAGQIHGYLVAGKAFLRGSRSSVPPGKSSDVI